MPRCNAAAVDTSENDKRALQALERQQSAPPALIKHAQIILLAARGVGVREPSNRIVCHFTLKHASWLNHIEMWLSILARKVIRRGDFLSVDDLDDKLANFIDFFNDKLAKPFCWTYTGQSLAA